MIGDTRYEPVAKVLPDVLPPITRKAILPYYLKLVKHFGKASLMPVGVAEQRALHRPCADLVSRRKVARACWASTKATTGHHKGWGRMIHDASHTVFEVRHPHAKPHDGGHATLEREMAEYVMAKGWIDKAKLKVTKPKGDERRRLKLARIDAAIVRWQSKHKRAVTALKKLSRQRKALERAMGVYMTSIE